MKKGGPINPIDSTAARLEGQLEEYNEAVRRGAKMPEHRETPSSQKIAVTMGLIAMAIIIGDQVLKYLSQG